MIPELIDGLDKLINNKLAEAKKLGYPAKDEFIIAQVFPLLDQALTLGFNVILNRQTNVYELVPANGDDMNWPRITAKYYGDWYRDGYN